MSLGITNPCVNILNDDCTSTEYTCIQRSFPIPQVPDAALTRGREWISTQLAFRRRLRMISSIDYL